MVPTLTSPTLSRARPPGDDREVFTLHELTREFSLDRVNNVNAVFDAEKLAWLNGKYISEVPAGELMNSVRDALRNRGCWHEELDAERRDHIFALIDMWQSRSRTINELADNIAPFLTEAFPYLPDAINTYIKGKNLIEPLEALRGALAEVDPWSQEEIESTLRQLAEKLDIEAGELIHASRVAVIGKPASPGIFEVLELMGRENTRARLARMLRYLTKVKAAQASIAR